MIKRQHSISVWIIQSIKTKELEVGLGNVSFSHVASSIPSQTSNRSGQVSQNGAHVNIRMRHDGLSLLKELPEARAGSLPTIRQLQK